MKSTYIEFNQNEYIDLKTITDKRLKVLINPKFESSESSMGVIKMIKVVDQEGGRESSENSIKELQSVSGTTSAKHIRKPKNPFTQRIIDEVRAKPRNKEQKTVILRIPCQQYMAFVQEYLSKDESIWSQKNYDNYIMDLFPEIKDFCSGKIKR